MTIESDLVIVIASVIGLFALSSCVAGWVERQWPLGGMIALCIALGLLGYAHLALLEGGLTLWSIPEAFIHVAARVL